MLMKPLIKIFSQLIGQLDEKEYDHLFKVLEDIQTEGKATNGIDDFNLAVKFLEHPDSVCSKTSLERKNKPWIPKK